MKITLSSLVLILSLSIILPAAAMQQVQEDQAAQRVLIRELADAAKTNQFQRYFSLINQQPAEERLTLCNRSLCDYRIPLYGLMYSMKAIHLAAVFGNTEAIGTLVRMGIDVNSPNDDNTTLLHFAALSKNSPETLALLIELGAQKDARDNFGYSALHRAAESGNIPAIIFLIKEQGFDPNERLGGLAHGLTPLQMVVRMQLNTEVFDTLLSLGADKYVLDSEGNNLLHAAAMFHNIPVVIALIHDHGFDPNSKNNRNKTPFQEATRHYCQAKFILLCSGAQATEEEKNECCLAQLASIVDKQALIALSRGSLAAWNPNVLHAHTKKTALIKAVEEGCDSCIRLLLKDQRTNANIQDLEEKSALHHVVTNHRDIIVSHNLLRLQRVNTALIDNQHNTPLQALLNQSILHNPALANSAEKKQHCINECIIIRRIINLFKLRKMKVYIYLSCKNARCSEKCTEKVCTHFPQLPSDVCLKIARLLTEESLPTQSNPQE